jgi:hypothetical protein
MLMSIIAKTRYEKDHEMNLTPDEIASYANLRRGVHLTAWAITFATDYVDASIVDMQGYRAGHLRIAQNEDKIAVEALSTIVPKRHRDVADVRYEAFGLLRAMNGKRARDYTQGVKRPFPENVLEIAARELGIPLQQ